MYGRGRNEGARWATIFSHTLSPSFLAYKRMLNSSMSIATLITNVEAPMYARLRPHSVSITPSTRRLAFCPLSRLHSSQSSSTSNLFTRTCC